MSISSQLLILNQTKQNVRTAINNKGVTVTDEAFAAYPDKVRLIPNGGGIYESNIILYVEAKQKNVVIPAGTETIGDYAFYCWSSTDERTNLNAVSMPNTVTSIGAYAFSWNVAISTINFSTSLESIGTGAFQHCHSLQSVTLPSSMRTLGANAFYECNSLSSVTLNEGLTSIGGGAFVRCYPLANITIASTVTSIGQGAFYGCSSMQYAICLPTTPPALGDNAFSASSTYPIYVPDESVLAYQVADGWSVYSSRIKGISEKP